MNPVATIIVAVAYPLRDCCISVSAAYVDATEDDASVTPTPSILVRRQASITVNRVA